MCLLVKSREPVMLLLCKRGREGWTVLNGNKWSPKMQVFGILMKNGKAVSLSSAVLKRITNSKFLLMAVATSRGSYHQPR